MDHKDIKIGVQVLYHPRIGGKGYEGTVRTEPWLMGGHTWVVHLFGMSSAYRKEIRDRDHVHAAACDALEPA